MAVFGVILRAAMAHVPEVQAASGVSSLSEGFEMVDTDAIVESFTRHLMTASIAGKSAASRRSRGTIWNGSPRSAGERRGIDVNGDLLVSMPPRRAPAEQPCGCA
jgi:hypothetical protein